MYAAKAIVLASLGLLTATPAVMAGNRNKPAVRVSVQPRHLVSVQPRHRVTFLPRQRERPRVVTQQVWVPGRWEYENRVVTVPGHWETYHRIETIPGHWEVFHQPVNRPGHYEISAVSAPTAGQWRTQTRRIYVPGRFVANARGRRQWVPAHTETRTERVYLPGRRVPQQVRRWVPGQCETTQARRWVPASQRTVQDRRWVPAATCTQRTRVFRPGHYETRTIYTGGQRREHDGRGVRVGLGDLQIQVGW